MNPVEYIEKTSSEFHNAEFAGYTIPGWYFWDETWANCHGPFYSEQEANEKLEIYIRECL